jgi:urease accessory protein
MFTANLLRLLHLCDPALPIGGFSHSAGLETYVQQGIVNNKETAAAFVVQQLSQNIHYTDAALLSLAYDAASNNDFDRILSLDEMCTAVKLPKEMRMASIKLGTRLLKIFEHKKAFFLLDQYKLAIVKQAAFGHYCIAFGMLAQALNIAKHDALTGFYYNMAAGFCTNSVKLIPLGQQDGQQILLSVFPIIEELVESSMQPDREMIGYCCTGFDVRSMQHEQLYTRLYMS